MRQAPPPTLWPQPFGSASGGGRAAWSLAHHDLHRRAQAKRHRRASGAGRADDRRRLARLARISHGRRCIGADRHLPDVSHAHRVYLGTVRVKASHALSSDGGGLLLRHTDRAIGIERVAACFVDEREQDQVVHCRRWSAVGIALGYEDSTTTTSCATIRSRCSPTGSSRSKEHAQPARARAATYHKIGHDPTALANLFVDLGRTRGHRSRSSSTSTRRRTVSFTATTAATATCRCTCSAAGTCSPPYCGPRTSTPLPARSRRWPGSSSGSARPGRGRGFCCGLIQVSPEMS